MMEKFNRSIYWRKFVNFYNIYLNSKTRKQRKNYKSIPIIINNFNRLATLQKLIKALEVRGYRNLFILDNNSTYPPLLEFYEKTNACVFMLKENLGHMAFWKKKEIFDRFRNGYYVLTDSDVLLNDECPDDFLSFFLEQIEKHYLVTKVGFALRIDDIPNYYSLRNSVIEWEQKFWKTELSPNVFLAHIDTTFALYRPYANVEEDFLYALRIGGNYTARHEGWYTNSENLSQEEEFYIKTANKSASWIELGRTIDQY
jgi:hypothetical protein